MSVITVNCTDIIGTVKNMHSVNNGPKTKGRSQLRDNFENYKKLNIPYARTHDASICYDYGAEHCVDVNGIFPDFGADAENPDNYDFLLTDLYLKSIIDAGTEPYYRLGTRIEHWDKKYNTLPPTDFKKWAVICEHIIAHYTKGWANGFKWKIEYWEIWNEPETWEGQPAITKNCWGGTTEEFFDFFETAAKHLKHCFPDLKIGGPALCCDHEWGKRFVNEMHRREAPLDFYSWHIYTDKVYKLGEDAENVRRYLDEAGYIKTESHVNEWNYVADWTDGFVDTLLDIKSEKGAAFISAMMIEGQHLPIDMMMYYDVRCDSIFNGLFDILTLRTQKPYYSLLAYSKLFELGKEVKSTSDDAEVYTLAAADEGKACGIVTYYTHKDNAPEKEITVSISGIDGKLNFYELNGENRFEKAYAEFANGMYKLKVKPQTVIFYCNGDYIL